VKNINRALIYLKGYRWVAIGAVISLLLVNVANLLSPQLLRSLIDDGITAENMRQVWIVAGLLVLVAVVRGVFNFLQAYWSEVASQGIAYEMRNIVFEKLQNLSFSYHDRSQTGKLMTRMTSDVELVRNYIGRGLLQLVSAVLMFLGTLVILLVMNWRLTMIFLAIIPVIGVIFAIFVRKFMPLSKKVQEELGKLTSILQENLSGMRIVKAFAREDYEIARYGRQNQTLLEKGLALVTAFSNLFPLIFLISNLGMLGIIWLGGLQVIGGSVSLGELVAFVNYQLFLLMPIFMLGFIGAMLSRASASADRIFEVIDSQSEIVENDDAIELPSLDGFVAFDNVSFRYVGAEQDALHGISFEAKPNQTVAILGRTGSGKSTIINLIPRFYDVSEGAVLVDGVDVRDVTLDSLRRQIGIVLQETTLFSGTIRDNIAYGRLDARQEEIEAAARVAQAHEFIMEIPEGYDSEVGERGVGLSGGQKQRIAIARAVLLNPKILIMDDSTSSVDAETEYKIQQALEALRQDRTTFIIAQKISTIRNADLILLLEDGQLVGKGTHEELIRESERYAEILDTQIGGGHNALVQAVEKEME
jgi:ATP-binding cassette, subfamily B, multidrug efflux pump